MSPIPSRVLPAAPLAQAGKRIQEVSCSPLFVFRLRGGGGGGGERQREGMREGKEAPLLSVGLRWRGRDAEGKEAWREGASCLPE